MPFFLNDIITSCAMSRRTHYFRAWTPATLDPSSAVGDIFFQLWNKVYHE